jgi:hypothetical protein
VLLSSCIQPLAITASSAAAAPQIHQQVQILQKQSPRIAKNGILRHLQENEDNAAAAVDDNVDPDAYATYPYDLSTFSIRFDKCQNVKYYSDDLAADEDATSPLAIKPLVAFRICPSTECQTCSSSQNYGKYVVDLESYLAFTVENQRASFEEMCNNCAELCNDAGEYCNGCGKLCYQYANLNAAGLVDASDYIECQELEMPDDENENGRRKTRRHRRTRRRRKLEDAGGEEGGENRDEDENQEDNADEDQHEADEDEPEEDEEESVDEGEEEPVYFIGPKCSSSGQKIEIGLFYDEYCTQAFSQTDESSMNLTTILGGTLSYHLMSHSFTDDGSICLACQEPADENENKNSNDAQDADDVNEMCEELYSAAAKCETPTGIAAGFIQTNRDEGDYENQVETEFMACTFINSIYWNSYTAAGDIEYRKPLDVYERYVTQRQAMVLASLGVFMACCFLATFWLQNKIKQVTEQNKLTGAGSGKVSSNSKSLGVMS